jgi:hypothetical protein
MLRAIAATPLIRPVQGWRPVKTIKIKMNATAVNEKYAVFITTSERTSLVGMVSLPSSTHRPTVRLTPQASVGSRRAPRRLP